VFWYSNTAQGNCFLCWCCYVTTKAKLLFIHLVDLRQVLTSYGAEYIISSNIDRLANEGLPFKNEYGRFVFQYLQSKPGQKG